MRFWLIPLLIFSSMVAHAQTTRLLTHIPKLDGGFAATLALQNDSVLTKPVMLAPYDHAGNLLQDPATLYWAVSPVSVLHLDAAQVLPSETAYVQVYGSERVRVSVLFRTAAQADASKAVVNEIRQLGKRFHILPTGGQTTGYWEGFAAVNPNQSNATLTLRLYRNPNMAAIAASQISLQGTTKTLGLFTDIFPDQDIQAQDFIIMTATQPVGLVILHGNTHSGDLTNVTPEPFTAAPVIETADPATIARDPFEILNATINEELLSFSLRFPNGCNQVRLVWDGSFMESFPVQARLHIAHDTSGLVCTEAITTTNETFDLAPLVQTYVDGGGDPADPINLQIMSPDGNEVQTTLVLQDAGVSAAEVEEPAPHQ